MSEVWVSLVDWQNIMVDIMTIKQYYKGMETIKCKCGCGQEMTDRDSRGRPREYIHGHVMNGRERPDRARPDSENKRTGRWRARNILIEEGETCALEKIGGCSQTKMHVHHRDGNPMNNKRDNIIFLCVAHHFLIERGRITLDTLVMPPFTISSGKRRYKW